MTIIPFILWISLLRCDSGNIVPTIHQYKSNITSRVGGTILLQCPISAVNANTIGFYISWTVNGIDENMLSVDTRYQFRDSNKVLEVTNLRQDDSGLYVCKGVTGYGVKEAAFNIVIKDEKFCRIPVNATLRTRFKPCFLNSLMQNEISYQKVVRDLGSSVEFDCSAAGSPPPKYLWMKGKSSADWIDNITGIRQPILRISRVKLEYSGYYTCLVSNSAGEISYTYTLVVREKQSRVPIITNDLGNITANIGAQAMLVGSITCNCKPVLQWLKRTSNQSSPSKLVPIPNPRLGEKNELYVILDPENSDSPVEIMEKNNDILVSVLKFKSIVPDDAGKYVLFATNGNYGMDYGVVYLDVRDQESSKKNHPRLVLFIAIPIFILILCFAVIFYCWSRRHKPQRVECPKRFCIGTSSVSSSTNIKSMRSHYPGSTTNTSGTTGKCSNGSSLLGKKCSMPMSDNSGHLTGNAIPLLPSQNCNMLFTSSANDNQMALDTTVLDPNLLQGYSTQFSPNKDLTPTSYSRMPIQQTVFPHSNSRVSNSSQPNTQSGSSNCSANTSKSNSYHPKSTNMSATPQPLSQPNILIAPYNQSSSAMPPYIITKGIDYGANNQTLLEDQGYSQHADPAMQAVPSMYYAQDYFPSHETCSSPNSYSYS